MNEVTDNTALQAFITDVKEKIALANVTYIGRAAKGSSKRKELLNELVKAQHLLESVEDFVPDGTVVVASVALNLSFDVTTIFATASDYSNHIRISIIVNDIPSLTLYDARVDMEATTPTVVFNAIKVAINAGGTGWTVSGTYPVMDVVAPTSVPANTFVYFMVHAYFHEGATAPYIDLTSYDSVSDIIFQSKPGRYGSDFLYVSAADSGVGYLIAYDSASQINILNLGAGNYLDDIVVNTSTGKIYATQLNGGADEVYEFNHTAASTWNQANLGNPGSSAFGGSNGIYNPYNASCYFIGSDVLIKIVAAGTMTTLAVGASTWFITCNTITGVIYTYQANTATINSILPASTPPTIESVIVMPFTNTQQGLAFYSPTGLDSDASFFCASSGTAIVYKYSSDLATLQRTITFTGKTVTGVSIPNESGDYLFVIFSDGEMGVYDMVLNVWMCNLYDSGKVVYNATKGYRFRNLTSIYAPELVADAEDHMITGTPIAEVLADGDNNCLTVTEQQTMIDLLSSTVNKFREC